jgi:2,3-bisphosphoglycerate-independent phosphoglycerate mutase
LKLESNEVAFRMNFITEADGHLADATGGQVSTKESKALINFLNKKISSDFVRFFPGAEYRHIAVLKDSHGIAALSARTTAPDSIVGERIDANLPKGPGEELLKKLMFDAKLLLQDHEINQVRVDLGENPANMIWLWGQGQRPQFEKFTDLTGLSGAMVADIEYAKGIARIAGLTVVENPGGAMDEDARLERLGRAALEVLRERDFVCLFLDGCDRASRKGDFKAKVSALESMDFFVLAKVKEYLEKNLELRVLVTPGYAVPWQLHKQTRDTVPFVIAGKNIMPDDIEKFSETISKASTLKANKGSELMKLFVQEAKVAV